MPRRTPLDAGSVEPEQCSIDLRLRLLKQSPFFAALAPQQVAEINLLFHEHGYSAGQVLYHAGDPAVALYIVAAGKVKLLRHTLSGQDVLLAIVTPGEFLGSLSTLGDETFPDTAQALTDCCVLAISVQDFQSTLQCYPPVVLAVLDIVSQRLRDSHEVIQQLISHSVKSRVASALLKVADRMGEEGADGTLLQVPLSRQDLAAMTGTSAETASRVVSQFRRKGLIKSGRRWFAITNRRRLAELATGE